MGDLGMHAMHLPLRLGWNPKRVYAQLQNVYQQRPDGKGGMVPCDTWDNAMLHTEIEIDSAEIPLRIETKRLAPGATNSWFIEILGVVSIGALVLIGITQVGILLGGPVGRFKGKVGKDGIDLDKLYFSQTPEPPSGLGPEETK